MLILDIRYLTNVYRLVGLKIQKYGNPDNATENIEIWKKNNPDPKRKIADELLNPILVKLGLEVDLKSAKAPLVLKNIKSLKPINPAF